ncbi:unnamed protein product [Pseudo-nitzschia multistriata]|uniref:Uncharacterized protein n=1 Tax=Pseudo-nitzschia multistriata TaxID=183589 RepID=A0A448YWW9_9STRA|nr:unnamed protein product [Pseudo-nitzschia multistriata]
MASFCSIEAGFPFVFFDGDGEAVNGTAVATAGGNGTGSCFFPSATCSPEGRVSDCCGISPSAGVATGANYMFLAFAFFMAPLFWAISAIYGSMTPEEREISDQKDEERKPRFITHNRCIPEFLKKTLLGVYELGLPFVITARVTIPIFAKKTQQRYMTVDQRTSLAASEAFMVPFFTIFTFVEEIVMIRVNYAVSENDKALTDRLVHAGLAGVIVTGTIGGIVGTALGLLPGALEALTIPGAENDVAVYPGCNFLEAVDVSMILPYWLLESWELIGKQIGGVLSGFLFGALEFNLLGWIGLVGEILYCFIWFGNIATYGNPVTLLGIAEFVLDWTTPILLTLFLVTPIGSQIREQTGVELSITKVCSYFLRPLAAFRKPALEQSDEKDGSDDINGDKDNAASSNGDGNDSDDDDDDDQRETMSLLIEGLKIMFMDIVIQACMTCSIYLALTTDGAIAYQITALQSELPAYGIAYAMGMAINTQILGPIFLSNGMHGLFVKYIKISMACVLVLVALICSSTGPFFRGLALDSGANACTYASSAECLPYFENVFGPNGEGGIYTLFFTYYAFPIAASIDAILLVMRATLLTLLDFDYMFYSTIAASISYVPAILVVTLAPLSVQNQAIGMFSAYYVPQVMLVFCFSARLVFVTRKLEAGETGPWSSPQKQKERRSSMQSAQSIRGISQSIRGITAEDAIEAANAEKRAADYSNIHSNHSSSSCSA